MNATYVGEWRNREDVEAEYKQATPTETELVYAGYEVDGYDGNAIVVFIREGKWFEHNDGHCSCNGLEWGAVEETTPEALLIRKGWPGLAEAVEQRRAALATP